MACCIITINAIVAVMVVVMMMVVMPQEVFMDVVQNSEFLMLPGEDVCSLLVSDDLNVSDEEAIFAAVVKWVKHDLSARRKYLPRLLSHVKLPLMTPQV